VIGKAVVSVTDMMFPMVDHRQRAAGRGGELRTVVPRRVTGSRTIKLTARSNGSPVIEDREVSY
jgi:hypothetical protein